MKLTEKMIKIVRTRVASNRPLGKLLGVDEQLEFESAVAALESIPVKNLEEARQMLAAEEAKLQVFGEDSREWGEAFHTSQHIANLIDIVEESKGKAKQKEQK